jgi:hypothetical protein
VRQRFVRRERPGSAGRHAGHSERRARAWTCAGCGRRIHAPSQTERQARSGGAAAIRSRSASAST